MRTGIGRIILFIDMDAFFASCEIASRPALRGKPVVVTNHYRHIVLTASYEAREFGIKTGMRLFEAKKLCRWLEVVYSDTDKYVSTSSEIHRMLLDITDRFEPLSIDEAVMDLTDAASDFDEAVKIALALKSRIRKTFDITCSIGISPSRAISKYAAELRKPDGLAVIRSENFTAELQKIAVEKLSGIGSSTAFALKGIGVRTAFDLMQCDMAPLLRVFGQNAFHLKSLITDDRVGSFYDVTPPKSISASHTLVRDTGDEEMIFSFLEFLVWRVAHKLKNEGAEAAGISVGVRFSDFSSAHKSVTLSRATASASTLYAAAKEVLKALLPACPDRAGTAGRPTPMKVRLLSFRAKCSRPRYSQLSFLEGLKTGGYEKACSEINNKYGGNTVKPAYVMLFERFGRPEPIIPPVFTNTDGKTYRHGSQ